MKEEEILAKKMNKRLSPILRRMSREETADDKLQEETLGDYWELVVNIKGEKPRVYSGGGSIKEMLEDGMLLNAIAAALLNDGASARVTWQKVSADDKPEPTKREGDKGMDCYRCGDANLKGDVELFYKGGCKNLVLCSEAYRCVGCGGWFHKDCLVEHFKREASHDWGREEERKACKEQIREAIDEAIDMAVGMKDTPENMKSKLRKKYGVEEEKK